MERSHELNLQRHMEAERSRREQDMARRVQELKMREMRCVEEFRVYV